MKTRCRRVLERRFAEWSAGKKRSALIAAALLGILITAESADAQCDGAAALSIVSGNSQSGAPGSPLPQPFVVQVSCPGGGSPIETVTWAIISGGGTLGASTTVSSGAGIASNTLTLAGQPNVVVSATVPGSTVSFSAASGTSVANALATVALNTATVQTRNIGLRLASLRGGARGVSISGLPVDVAREPVALGPAASALPAALANGITGSRLGLFINGEGSFGKHDPTERDPGFDFHTAGAILGVDYRFTDQFILGSAIGYLATNSELDAGAGELTAHGISLSVFGTYYLRDEYYIDGIATYGWTWYDTERQVGGVGTPAFARGDPEGRQVALSVSGGRNFSVGGLTLGPYGRVDYTNVEVDGFREHGGGASNVRIDSQDITSVITALGGQGSYAINTAWGVFQPTVSAEWQHEFAGDARVIRASAIGGASINARTDDPDRDYFTLGAGLVATLRGGKQGFIHYHAIVGRDDFTHHGFTAGIRFEF